MVTSPPEKGHLRLPNWLVERLARLHLRPAQWQIIWAVWRQTLCWQAPGKWRNHPYPISTSDLVTATGLQERQVKREISQLVARGIILRESIPGGRQRKPVTAFNLDPTTWGKGGKTDTLYSEGKGGKTDTLYSEGKGGETDTLYDRNGHPLGPELSPFTTETDTLSEPESGTRKKHLKKHPKETAKERLFDLWNSLRIIQHGKLTDKRTRAIMAALKDHSLEEICQAVINYSEILHGKEFFWDYRWTLEDFLNRGLEKFIDGEVARQNYRKDKGGQDGRQEPAAERPRQARRRPITYTNGAGQSDGRED